MSRVVSIKHIDFVVGKVVCDDEEHKELIFVFTHRKNGKIRKKKVDCIGRIFKQPKTKNWCFASQPDENDRDWAFNDEVLFIIGSFISALKHKTVIYDTEKGEFRPNETKNR